MVVLALKLLLAPSFVVATSLVARRFGSRIGGIVGGQPVIGGPILLVLGLVHGRGFAADAAQASLLGFVSLAAYVAVYGRLAARAPWAVALPAACAAFLAATGLLSLVDVPPGAALVAAAAALGLSAKLLPAPGVAATPSLRRPPTWDLPVRAACAAVMVVALTAAASGLGPELSGLLTPFPILTSVLASFTHAQRGAPDVLSLLRGFLAGFLTFALFCFVCAVALPRMGLAPALLLGVAASTALAATILFARDLGRRPDALS